MVRYNLPRKEYDYNLIKDLLLEIPQNIENLPEKVGEFRKILMKTGKISFRSEMKRYLIEALPSHSISIVRLRKPMLARQ